jgi:hypothetical protein
MEYSNLQNKYFYCYSINLYRAIRQNNIPYVMKGIHPKTNKTYWVFERNQLLSDVLKNWK